jgi:hypothetical protein
MDALQGRDSVASSGRILASSSGTSRS